MAYQFFLLVPVLVYAAYSDLRWLRIPNMLSLLLLGLFCFVALTLPLQELWFRCLAAAAVFCIGVLLFALRAIGAGDVKLLSALMLFVPSASLMLFSQVLSLSLLLGVGFILACRRSHLLDRLDWKSIKTAGAFPMGISIALAGVVHPVMWQMSGAV